MTIFSVGISGLTAAQVGIQTTSHNIANASTPGFNRQQIVQTTNPPMFTGAGYVGQGTNVETVQRIYNRQVAGQLLTAQSGVAEMDSYKAQIDQIDNLTGDPSAGLSPALTDFFKAIQEMAANPASLPARQSMLSASQALVARFQSINERMTEVRDGVNSQITSEVGAVNSYAQQIAALNQRIVYAQAAGPNQPANDLLDQRDQLIADLNKKIGATILTQSDGTYSVFVGNGQPLVIGTQAYQMQAVAAPDDPERLDIAIMSPTGSRVYIPESQVAGGSLGGLISFRSESLDGAQNALGRIAMALATDINAQHKLGQDMTGALGGNYFNVGGMSPTVRANSNNAVPTQQPTVTINSVGNLSTSDYRLTYDGANYTLSRIADGQSWSSATLATLPWPIDGITVTAGAWTPVTSDSFLIQPTRNAAASIAMAISDPRSIAAAAPVVTGTTLSNSGTATIDAGSVTSVASLPLGGTVTLTYNSATSQFVVTGPIAAGPFAYTSGTPISFAGMTVTITGTPANGDSFTIGNNINGVADNRNGVLLGALQTQSRVAGGTSTYQSAYSTLVAEVGNKAREVEVTGQAQQNLADQAQTARDQVSGVNLDEEAANLLRYQQAYQAAAKMLDIANKLFDQILALGQ